MDSAGYVTMIVPLGEKLVIVGALKIVILFNVGWDSRCGMDNSVCGKKMEMDTTFCFWPKLFTCH